ncbi:hypothetical protein BSKO_00731 [Bryopsis sp. KO-2023]|nr:hypothetical protein BSKO_00731 [Bryopsis sp. KO-2023]
MDIGGSTGRSKETPVSSPDVQEGCVICLRDGFNDAANVEGCGHQFCLDCIRRWAGARRNPVCPLCNNKLAFILRADGSREAVEPGKVNNEDELDLACLDHSYFIAETGRLLRRAQSCQDMFYSRAFGSSRAGSEKAEQSYLALGEVIGTLTSQRVILEQGSQFDPGDMIQELYNLDMIVQKVRDGTMDFGAGTELASRVERYGADDADDLPPDDDDIFCDDIDDYNQYRARASKPNRPSKAPVQRGKRSRKRGTV